MCSDRACGVSFERASLLQSQRQRTRVPPARATTMYLLTESIAATGCVRHPRSQSAKGHEFFCRRVRRFRMRRLETVCGLLADVSCKMAGDGSKKGYDYYGEFFARHERSLITPTSLIEPIKIKSPDRPAAAT